MKLKDLPVGALVCDKKTMYDEDPILWRIAAKNHKGFPEDSVTLMSEKILCLKVYDAIEEDLYDHNPRSNIEYKLSNINQWLNSDKEVWYSPTHTRDKPPSATYTKNLNPYEDEKGFLTNFSSELKREVKDTDIACEERYGAGMQRITVKVFLPSARELDMDSHSAYQHPLELFLDNPNRRKAYVTNKVYEKNKNRTGIFPKEFRFSEGLPAPWWARPIYGRYHYGNPFFGDNTITYTSAGYNAQGATNHYTSTNGHKPSGIRPFINVSDGIEVDSILEDEVYIILWNEPPSIPRDLTFRRTVILNKAFSISWEESIDSDKMEGERVSYVLERRLDEGDWSEVYRGEERSYLDTVVEGNAKVNYRVKAIDGRRGESDYLSGEEAVLVRNLDTMIHSEVREKLGEKSGAFSIPYSLSDVLGGETCTVTEYVDGVQKRTFSGAVNQAYSFSLGEDEWKEVLNGKHNIRVKIVDSSNGEGEKVFTFSKNEKHIEVSLSTPLEADDRINCAVISLDAEIASGATLVVEVCNNGFDAEPDWQIVTEQVKSKRKIFFSNETKTAEKWGLNVRVRVEKGESEGVCSIRGIGGNFE